MKKKIKIANLVKSKLFKYSAMFIYLFAFVAMLADGYSMFAVLAVLSLVLFIMSVIYDIKFIGDNLK